MGNRFKKMIYKDYVKREVLGCGVYKGYQFAIISHGTHRLDFNSNIPLSELDNFPGFILYLMQVKNKCCKIIIDKEYISEDVSLTFEYEYERC